MRTVSIDQRRLPDSLHAARTSLRFDPFTTIFTQGDRCNGVMHVDKGLVRLSVTSGDGRSAVLSVLHPGSLFGEGALAGQRRRKSTAEAITPCTVSLVTTAEMRRLLRKDATAGDWFQAHMLGRNSQMEMAIADHQFNGSEKRLARALLLLAGFDEHQLPRHDLPIISRDLLAEVSGTTRPTVNRLMNSFRKRGFLERHSVRSGGLQVHRSMMSVLLQN